MERKQTEELWQVSFTRTPCDCKADIYEILPDDFEIFKKTPRVIRHQDFLQVTKLFNNYDDAKSYYDSITKSIYDAAYEE